MQAQSANMHAQHEGTTWGHNRHAQHEGTTRMHMRLQHEVTTCVRNIRAQHACKKVTSASACKKLMVPVRYRPNAASGGWSYGCELMSWWHMKGIHPVWNGYIILLNIHTTFYWLWWLVLWLQLPTFSNAISVPQGGRMGIWFQRSPLVIGQLKF